MLLICDGNPKYTDHWAFEQQDEYNAFYSQTCYLDNMKLPDGLAAERESKCPWDFADSHIEIVDRFLIYQLVKMMFSSMVFAAVYGISLKCQTMYWKMMERTGRNTLQTKIQTNLIISYILRYKMRPNRDGV